MKPWNNLKEWFIRLRILSWPLEEREALMRTLMEVYTSDGVFTDDEKADFENRIQQLNVSKEKVENLPFSDSLALLKKVDRDNDILFHWLAAALFADDDFDKSEQQFVEKFSAKFALDKDLLEAHIKKAREKRVTPYLEEWLRDISKP